MNRLLGIWAAALATAGFGSWILFEAVPGLNWGLWTLLAAAGLALSARLGGRTIAGPLFCTLSLACTLAGGAAVTADPEAHVWLALAVAALLAVAMLLAADPANAQRGLGFLIAAPLVAATRGLVEAGRRAGELAGLLATERWRPAVRGPRRPRGDPRAPGIHSAAHFLHHPAHRRGWGVRGQPPGPERARRSAATAGAAAARRRHGASDRPRGRRESLRGLLSPPARLPLRESRGGSGQRHHLRRVRAPRLRRADDRRDARRPAHPGARPLRGARAAGRRSAARRMGADPRDRAPVGLGLPARRPLRGRLRLHDGARLRPGLHGRHGAGAGDAGRRGPRRRRHAPAGTAGAHGRRAGAPRPDVLESRRLDRHAEYRARGPRRAPRQRLYLLGPLGQCGAGRCCGPRPRAPRPRRWPPRGAREAVRRSGDGRAVSVVRVEPAARGGGAGPARGGHFDGSCTRQSGWVSLPQA